MPISLKGVLIIIFATSMVLPSFAQSGCTRLPIGSIVLPANSAGTGPISVTPPPSLDV